MAVLVNKVPIKHASLYNIPTLKSRVLLNHDRNYLQAPSISHRQFFLVKIRLYRSIIQKIIISSGNNYSKLCNNNFVIYVENYFLTSTISIPIRFYLPIYPISLVFPMKTKPMTGASLRSKFNPYFPHFYTFSGETSGLMPAPALGSNAMFSNNPGGYAIAKKITAGGRFQGIPYATNVSAVLKSGVLVYDVKNGESEETICIKPKTRIGIVMERIPYISSSHFFTCVHAVNSLLVIGVCPCEKNHYRVQSLKNSLRTVRSQTNDPFLDGYGELAGSKPWPAVFHRSCSSKIRAFDQRTAECGGPLVFQMSKW